MKICPKCGEKNHRANLWCHCGFSFSKSDTEQSQIQTITTVKEQSTKSITQPLEKLSRASHTNENNENSGYPIKANFWLLFAGWIFALLGGFIGMAIGGHLWGSRVNNPSDNSKIYKYDEDSRTQGIFMHIVAAIILMLCVTLRYSH